MRGVGRTTMKSLVRAIAVSKRVWLSGSRTTATSPCGSLHTFASAQRAASWPSMKRPQPYMMVALANDLLKPDRSILGSSSEGETFYDLLIRGDHNPIDDAVAQQTFSIRRVLQVAVPISPERCRKRIELILESMLATNAEEVRRACGAKRQRCRASHVHPASEHPAENTYLINIPVVVNTLKQMFTPPFRCHRRDILALSGRGSGSCCACQEPSGIGETWLCVPSCWG